MKKLKKAIALISAAVLSLGISACTQTKTYKMNSGSYWLDSPSTVGVVYVDETCVYDVKAIPNDSNKDLVADLSGTLTTHLTQSTYEGKACYLFTTELEVKGSYLFANNEYAVEDKTSSECYFLGVNDGMFPLYSSKTVKSTSPKGSFDTVSAIESVEYSYNTVYNTETLTAISKFTPAESCAEQFSTLPKEITHEKFATGYFFDNECMLFFPRGSKLEEGFSQRFKTIDVCSQAIRTMNISVDTEQAMSKVEIPNYSENGTLTTTKEFSVYNLRISIADTFSGSSIKLAFCTNEIDGVEYNNYSRLVKMTTALPFNTGSLEYLLKSVERK